MKSAYELAMERLGGASQEYTSEQKTRLAEVDSIYDAKVAQAKINAQTRRAGVAGDREALEQIAQDMTVELASLEERRERDKARLREEFKQG
jgi:ABC-type Na+ efflux pump permease subunit